MRLKAFLLGGMMALALPAAANAAPGAPVHVHAAQSAITTTLGHEFTVRSSISNTGATTRSGLIAHLNVLSIRKDVYVDPEDWSSHRTRYLQPLGPGRSITIPWTVKAVNSGSFAVYIAVLPATRTDRQLQVGPAVRVQVADRKTLNTANVVPFALSIPVAVGLAALASRFRRRRGPRPGVVPDEPLG